MIAELGLIMIRDTMKLRIDYVYDPESRNWCFEVPSLRIIGGAETREEAQQQAIDAVAFTLESDNEEAPPENGEVSYLHLTLQP